MTQKANILSFDEVKARGASAPRTVSRRPAHSAQSNRHRRQPSGAHDAAGPGSAAYLQGSSRNYERSYERSAKQRASASTYQASYGQGPGLGRGQSRYAQANGFGERPSRQTNGYGADLSASSNARFAYGSSASAPASRRSASARPNMEHPAYRGNAGSVGYAANTGSASGSAASMRQSRQASSPARTAADADASLEDEVPDQDQAYVKKEGFFTRTQKRFRRAKADKAFDRTIGAQDRKRQAQAQQASRPALYEMRMGSTHRKSARMQEEGKKEKRGFSLPFGFSFTGSLSAAATRGIVALAAVAFTVVMLYPSCQSYYIETRQMQQLQAEYTALTDYNNEMQSEINYLNTDEGLEDYARSELGWVRDDEHVATVEGVESSADGTAPANNTHSPLNETIPAPDTWYSGVLDVLFGYHS